MTGPGVPDARLEAIRGEVRRASLTITALAVGSLLVSVVLAMFGGSPWETTRTVWTVFAVIAWIRSQLALSRIDVVMRGPST